MWFMAQKSTLLPPAAAGFVLAVTAGLVGWSAGASADVTPIQAKPAPPGVVLPPATDEQGPLLTPEIRPSKPTPDLKPEQPDRKAEPKPDLKTVPPRKDARPAPSPDAKPDRQAEPKLPPSKSDPKADQKPDSKSAGPTAPGSKSAAKTEKPGLAVVQPRTAAEREKALSDLYAYLAAADDAKQAQTISQSIERLWVTSGSDTVSLLMQRAMQAANTKDADLALKLLDAVVSLAPDYAEGWNRRAYVHYTQNQIDLALGDLRRTLALDPNHFKALEGLVHILKDIGRKKDALAAARKLLDVNPYYDGMKQIVDELSREIEGRGI